MQRKSQRSHSLTDEKDEEGAHLVDDCCEVDDPLLGPEGTSAVFDADDTDEDAEEEGNCLLEVCVCSIVEAGDCCLGC